MRRLLPLLVIVTALLLPTAAGAAVTRDDAEMIRDLDGLLRLPPLLTPGETIEMTPLDPKRTPASGQWIIAGQAARQKDGGTLSVTLPRKLHPRDPLEILYLDSQGKRVVEASGLEQARIPPESAETPGRPRLGPCSDGPVGKDLSCVCGWFPPAGQGAVLLDGQPAGQPVARSRRSLCFRLPPGAHRIAGAAKAGFTPSDTAETVSIQIQSSFRGKLEVGQSVPLVWTVTGTDRPVRLRLRNGAPGVLRLEGGDLQIVATSGGSPNTVTRAVVALRPGSSRIVAEPEEGSSPARSREYLDLLSQAFRRELARIAEETRKAIRELPATGRGALYRTTSVLSLLDATEARVRESLPYPELAGFHESLADFVAELRGEIESLPSRRASLPGPEVVPASMRRSSGTVEKEQAEPILKRLVDLLSENASRSPLRSLCILTSPEDLAHFRIYPQSFPSGFQETTTNAIVANLFVGKYRYEVRKDGFQDATATVDLLRETRQVLECPLMKAPATALPCRALPGEVDRCLIP